MPCCLAKILTCQRTTGLHIGIVRTIFILRGNIGILSCPCWYANNRTRVLRPKIISSRNSCSITSLSLTREDNTRVRRCEGIWMRSNFHVTDFTNRISSMECPRLIRVTSCCPDLTINIPHTCLYFDCNITICRPETLSILEAIENFIILSYCTVLWARSRITRYLPIK